MAAEVGLVFSFWNEDGSFFASHKLPIALVSTAIFVLATWQNILTRRIDDLSIKGDGK